MSSELREAVIIGIECILFSLLLFIIFFFSGYAKDSLRIKQLQDSAMTDIEEYRNIYQFSLGKEINKSNLVSFAGEYPYQHLTESHAKEFGTVLTGDDIVRFVGLYPKEYNVIIVKDGTRLELTKETEYEKWIVSNVNSWLDKDIISNYYCVIVYDDLTDVYETVIFYKEIK